MRVVMLGHSGVGKTTYMASLYGVMQQNVDGFRLRAVNDQDHRYWLSTATEVSKGKYPPPTDQSQEYQFYLRYLGSNVLQFTWSDYRGGALQESKDSQQTQTLLQELKAADGIMLFFDGDALACGSQRNHQIGRMISLTTQALQDLDRSMALAIVLTKMDLVSEMQPEHLKNLGGLVSAINASSSVFGALIPIACGRELRNVSMPLLFSIHAAVLFQYVSVNAALKSSEQQAKTYEEMSRGVGGALDWVVSRWNSQPTFGDLAKQRKEQTVSKQLELKKIEAPALSLGRYVERLPLIKSGFELLDYAQQINQVQLGVRSDVIPRIDPFSIFDS
jgi:GTPase SAR1 family protein